jgi:hypothetical protein
MAHHYNRHCAVGITEQGRKVLYRGGHSVDLILAGLSLHMVEAAAIESENAAVSFALLSRR